MKYNLVDNDVKEIRCLNLEGATDSLSRNVGNKLSNYAA
jgi:hypothetical protein